MTGISSGVDRTFVAIHPNGRRQSHCSSLLITRRDRALIAFFAGEREGASDSRIMITMFPASSIDTPGPLQPTTTTLDTGLGLPHWNPVLTEDDECQVWLFFKVGHSIQDWHTWVCRSADDGRTWSPPQPLVSGDSSGGRGPVRHPPLALGDAWVAPGSVERWTDPPRWDCFADVSTDRGRSWSRAWLPLDHPTTPGAGCIQPAFWLNTGGGLTALCRSTAGRAYRSTSVDGRTWSELRPTELPNNNSGLAVVPLPDGRILCVHNPASDNWGARCPLVASVSDDDGLSWSQSLVIEDGSPPPTGQPGNPGPDPASASAIAEVADRGRPRTAAATGVVTDGAGEYSYPSAALVGDKVWVSYTWQRRGIMLATFPYSSL